MVPNTAPNTASSHATPSHKENLKIAVDLGGTKIDIALIDTHPRIVQRHRIPTNASQGSLSAVTRIVEIVRHMITPLPPRTVRALAICTPGPIDRENGRILNAHNLGWGVVPLRAMLEERLSIPVVVEHDAKAAALGEFYWGRGQSRQSMVYIVIGTGMGGAIIYNGALLRGERNGAGEIGGITLDWNGRKGRNGVPGSGESLVAGPSIEEHYRALCAARGRPLKTGEGDGRQIGQLAQEGDPLALQIITQAGRALGTTIATLLLTLDITLYVVGSSVAKLGDILLKPARQALLEYAYASMVEGVEIELGTIIDKAALLGCYSLIQDRE